LSVALKWLNDISPDDARKELLKCCGSRRWAEQMLAARPFQDIAELQDTALSIWQSLTPADWLQAFQSHPKIGEQKAAAVVSEQAQQWSGQEQAGVQSATDVTLDSLAQLNREYEAKFGYIYIVCASGKSSDELLEILKERIKNDPSEELVIAAREQAKITALRLNKLLSVPI